MNDKGTTYVEILISLLILAMTIPMLINIFQFMRLESKRTKEGLILPYIAQAYIEKTIAVPISTFSENLSGERVEYDGYFFEHIINPYWNGNMDVTYYIIGQTEDQTEQDYSIDIYGFLEDSSYIIINAMEYKLERDVYIEGQDISHLDNIIIYCTSYNSDKIHIEDSNNAIMVVDNTSRKKIMFRLTVFIYENPEDEIPILSMETLFEKEI